MKGMAFTPLWRPGRDVMYTAAHADTSYHETTTTSDRMHTVLRTGARQAQDRRTGLYIHADCSD